MLILSIIGLLRMLLLIVGAFTLIRFLGKLMIAKRDLDAQKLVRKHNEAIDKERRQKLKDFGRVTVKSPNTNNSSKTSSDSAEYTDFEEIKD